MAKKKTIDLANAEPLRDLPSSGIQVNYKHQTIIASDETCEYALLTGGKVCEANIGVVYIKPAPEPEPNYVPVNLTDNATNEHTITSPANIVLLSNVNGKLVNNVDKSSIIGVIPVYDENEREAYFISIYIVSEMDNLTVTANGHTLSYVELPSGDHGYIVTTSSNSYPQPITLSIENKDGR